MADAPLLLIGAGLGAAGAAKVAGAQFTKDNFARWGYPEPTRVAVGAIEIGVAALAFAGLKNRELRPLAAIGTLCSMTGAVLTHLQGGDALPNFGPPLLLAGAGVLVLLDESELVEDLPLP